MTEPWRRIVALVLTALLLVLTFALGRSALQAASTPDTDAAELLAIAAAMLAVGVGLYGVTARK